MKKQYLILCIALLSILFLLIHSPAHAGTFTAFGPKTFVRGNGQPVVETTSFNIKNPNTSYTLKIYNGGINYEYSKVSSAIIKLNGSSIFDANDFNQQVTSLQKQVNISNSNQLQVELRSASGSGLTIIIEGEDSDPPSVVVTFPGNGLYTKIPSASVVGSASDATSWVSNVTVNGTTAAQTGKTYTSNILLTEGSNTITATATDAGGNTGSAIVSVILDTIPPKITIDPIPSLTNKAQLTITGKIEDASPISSFTVNSSPVTLTNNTFTATVILAEGNNNIIIAATDQAGNTSAVTSTISYAIPQTGPTLTIQSPTNGEVFASRWTRIMGSINDGTATVTMDGEVCYVWPTPLPNDFTFYCKQPAPLASGANTFTITATNAAGGATTETVTVYYRDTAPPIILTRLIPTIATSPSIDIAAYITEDTGISSVKVNDTEAAISKISDGYYSATASNVQLIAGANTITITATDTLGNASTAVTTITYIPADTTAPVISITSPSNGSTLTTSTVAVTGTIDDNTATVTINGVTAYVSNNSFTATGIALTESANTITVTAADQAGNTSTAAITVYRDSIAPVASITSPVNGSAVNTSMLTITGAIDDKTATVIVNGVIASVSNNTFTASGITLTNGANIIKVTATDPAKNISTATVSVTYVHDTTPPVIVISSPANGTRFNTCAYIVKDIINICVVTVTGIIDDNTAIVEVNGMFAVVSNNTFSGNTALSEGTSTITVTATDPAGNTSSATTTVYLDTTSPQIVTKSPANNALNVPIDLEITVKFNEPIDPSTISSSIFTLYSETGTVPGTTTYDEGTYTAVFKPISYLAPYTNYTATIKSGIKDTLGNQTTSDYTWSFKTGIPAITVTITEPQAGTTINKTQILIKGTVESRTPDMGIKVNGVLAEISGNNWAAIVPLTIGTNTITAEAVNGEGGTGKTSITINTQTQNQSVKITTNPQSGIAPLNTTFNIDTSISNTITSYKIDYEGDGATDLETTSKDGITHIYDTPGIYYSTVTIMDSQNNTYTESTIINVLDKTQMDVLLKGKWEGMRGALGLGSIVTSLSYFSDEAKQLYNDLFTALSSQLPQIAQGMQDIQLIYVKDNAAKYRIRKNELYGGQMLTITYYIYFSKDINGLWKIERF